jgi:Beta-lactamase superfamily domain
VVYERNGVRVTAFEVDHGAAIKPAYGYRIDYRGRSVLISGDTRFSENLIRNGNHVDLLVHEVAASKPELLQNIVIRRILDHHTQPPEAATVFNRTQPVAGPNLFIRSCGSPVPRRVTRNVSCARAPIAIVDTMIAVTIAFATIANPSPVTSLIYHHRMKGVAPSHNPEFSQRAYCDIIAWPERRVLI